MDSGSPQMRVGGILGQQEQVLLEYFSKSGGKQLKRWSWKYNVRQRERTMYSLSH